MNTGNLYSQSELLANKNKVETTQAKNEVKDLLLINLLPVLSMLAVIFPILLRKGSGLLVAKISILTLILSAAAVFYIRVNSQSLLVKKYSKWMITLSYLISLSISLLITKPDVFCFWMIGCLFVSMLIDNKLGLLFHFNISFILGIFLDLHPETVMQLLITGLLLCILSASLKQKSTVIYAAIIILSTNITLSFAINNFIINSKMNQNYMSLFFSILTVLVITYLLYWWFDRKNSSVLEFAATNVDNLKKEATVSILDLSSKQLDKSASFENVSNYENIDENETFESEQTSKDEYNEVPVDDEVENVQDTLPGYLKGLRSSYELLNDENNILLQKMKDYSNKLYKHAIQIGDISSRAAKVIGADENLAKAGGLYHDVGKMAGKNYIEEGLKIAEDYSFPKELVDILKQHNINYEKPSSVEAAIVMLSDNVISTIRYITNSGEHRFSSDKIIDNLFRMRLEKGSLDNSSLSLMDYNKLRDFYKQEFTLNK